MSRRVGVGLCLAGFVLVVLAGILGTVQIVGTDAGLYHELQMRAGILGFAGISEENLIWLDGALADCLKGDAGALAELEEIEVRGEMQPPFNETELIHMEDCRRLFVLLRRVLTAAVVAGAAMLAAGVWLCRDRRWVRRAAWIAPLALAIPLGAFAGWAAVDFDSAFNFFHKMLFTNDLWLLDPRTDLLIRICPQSMFMNMGLRIGLMSLAWALAVPALATLITAMKKERV